MFVGSAGRSVGAVLVSMSLVVTGCTSGEDTPVDVTTTTANPLETTTSSSAVPEPSTPRLVASPTALRFPVDNQHPTFIHNVYLSDNSVAELAHVRELWPDDLEKYLTVQLVLKSQPPDPAEVITPKIDAVLTAADGFDLPIIVQVAALDTWTGPAAGVLDDMMKRHTSFAGVAAAEFSAPIAQAVGGLTDADMLLLISLINLAAQNRAYFLWQDMGYLGPHVFVDAGINPALFKAISEHSENVIIQAKRNGALKRLVTSSAALGLWLSGSVGNWGVNSEDWIWWESGFEKRFAPQVAGALTVAGFPRSPRPTSSRLSYPESMFGIEMLVAAGSGATVFALESPTRGYGDTSKPSPMASAAGREVVFPVIRAIVEKSLISPIENVRGANPVALRPNRRDQIEFNSDEVFRDVLTPAECGGTSMDCARAQWLPKSSQYGALPIVPALDWSATAGDWKPKLIEGAVLADSAQRVAQIKAAFERTDHGTSWSTEVGGNWLVVNPNENSDVATTLHVVPHGVFLEATLPAHCFLIASPNGKGMSIYVNNFRTSQSWWTAASDDGAEAAYLASSTPDAADKVEIKVEPAESFDVTLEIDGKRVGKYASIELRGSTTVQIVEP